MRYFYDTEFLEDGSTIDFISIGIVAGDGREYYAINSDADFHKASKDDFQREHVLPHLPGEFINDPLHFLRSDPTTTFSPDLTHSDYRPHWIIRNEVREFIKGDRESNELWAYYCSYDHVALAQLFGRMVDLPESIPMFTHDLKVELVRLGLTSEDITVQDTGHHSALYDARWNRDVYEETH